MTDQQKSEILRRLKMWHENNPNQTVKKLVQLMAYEFDITKDDATPLVISFKMNAHSI